jgi:hypothetical protein
VFRLSTEWFNDFFEKVKFNKQTPSPNHGYNFALNSETSVLFDLIILLSCYSSEISEINLQYITFDHCYLQESFSYECVTVQRDFLEPSDTFVCPLEPDRAWPPLWACPSANTFETGRPDKPSAGACWSRSRWKQGSCSRCCL